MNMENIAAQMKAASEALEAVPRGRVFDSNVLDKKRMRAAIKSTLRFLSHTLSQSLGPYGSTTIVQDKLMQHYCTKDGYAILSNVRVNNEVVKTIIQMIQKISRRQVRTVGDGSTSAIVVANQLFVELEWLLDKHGVSAKDAIDMLKLVGDELCSEIRRRSVPIDVEGRSNFDRLKDVAYISNNNDDDMSETVFAIFRDVSPYATVNIETSPTEKDEYLVSSGIEVSRGYIHFNFANQPDKKTCMFESPTVFMCNGILDKDDAPLVAALIDEKSFKPKRPLVIVAKDFDRYMRALLFDNKMQYRDAMQVCAVDMATGTRDAMDRFDDLAIYLGAVVYDKNGGQKPTDLLDHTGLCVKLGMCSKAVITNISTKFIDGLGDSGEIAKRIEFIKKDLDELSRLDQIGAEGKDFELFQLKRRIASLGNTMVTLYVGGETEMEKTTRKYLFEDAVYACQSAIRNGYVTGGNLMVPKIMADEAFAERLRSSCNSAFGKVVENLERKGEFWNDLFAAVGNAFSASFRMVLSNAEWMSQKEVDETMSSCVKSNMIYNLKARAMEGDSYTRIVNSSETDVEIVRSCFSIVGLLATSNQFLSVTELSFANAGPFSET